MEKQEFDKPFVDFPDLVKLLKSRGLQINNPDVAEDLFKTYGYYPIINGFKKTFQSDPQNEKYRPNANLETIFGEFTLDSQFQELFLTSVFSVENHFKNIIGYLIAKNFGVNNHKVSDHKNPDSTVPCFLDLSNYHNANSVKKKATIDYIYNHVLTSHDNPTAYYRKNKNHIPPWIMMRNMMLGSAIKYYQILPEVLKSEIVDEMIQPIQNENHDQKKALFLITVDILKQFRNAAAHSSPLYLLNAKLDNKPATKSIKKYLGEHALSNSEGKKGIGTTNLYAALLSLMLLTRNLGQRENLINKLKQIEQSYCASQTDQMYDVYMTYLSMAGLPVDFIKRLDATNQNLLAHNTTSLHVTIERANGNIERADFQTNIVPEYNIAQNRKVYIAPTGKKYHFDPYCAFLRTKAPKRISIIEAQREKLKPCSKCCNH